ncbi:MAG: hypothetical protein IPP78_15405 [Holophagaceae bacterium]|nr:hypothetical protein [Holophagaceae bacterium]
MPRLRTSVVLPALLVLAHTPLVADDHPTVFNAALGGAIRADFSLAEKAFLKISSKPGKNRLIALYEMGGLTRLTGDSKRSVQFFKDADDVAHEYEGRAVASAGAGARQVGAVLSNDKALKYEGQGFEKVMSRTLNAMNFLLLSDTESARVEIRKADEYQQLERKRHEKEVAELEAEQARDSNARNAGGVASNETVQAQLEKMNKEAAKVRNSFENAFTYYLSSQIYRAEGVDGLNDAWVDAKRALELAPDAPAVRKLYLDIAKKQDHDAYLEATARWGAAADTHAAPMVVGSVSRSNPSGAHFFGVALDAPTSAVVVNSPVATAVTEVPATDARGGRKGKSASKKHSAKNPAPDPPALAVQSPVPVQAPVVEEPPHGNVVFIYEAGLLPRKHEVKIDLPVPSGSMMMIASITFPVYLDMGSAQEPMEIALDEIAATTSVVVDMRPIAAKGLKEKMPGILTRTIAGAIAKAAIQKEIEKRGGFFAGLVAKVATIALTHADLRSWLSIPGEVQAADLSIPPGKKEIRLSGRGWSDRLSLDVQPGATYLVSVKSVGGFSKTQVASLGRHQAPDSQPAQTVSPVVDPAAKAPASAPAVAPTTPVVAKSGISTQ